MIRYLWPLLFSTQLFASGVITLDGTVKKFNPDTIELSDGNKIYTLDRKKMAASDQLKNLKSGQHLVLQVPFTAITALKHSN
jgi:hypothetical protein